MATLYVTQGLPASGKTTEARAWVAAAVASPAGEGSRARINRDDLRAMLFGGWTGEHAHEEAVTAAQRAAVGALLRRGLDVVTDDTNLRTDVMDAWRELAADVNAAVQVWDLTGVPLDECLRRNELRRGLASFVPPEVIRGMSSRYLGAP